LNFPNGMSDVECSFGVCNRPCLEARHLKHGELNNFTNRAVETDESDDIETKVSSTIQSKFLSAQVNLQKSKATERAIQRIAHVKIPKQANESDVMFENLPKTGIIKTDKQLSQIDEMHVATVADYLKGCCNFKDSQSKLTADRIKTGLRVSGTRGAVGASPRHAGPQGATATASQSSALPSKKHTAFVELCCGPGSFLGNQAISNNLETLRITKQSRGLQTPVGREAASRDVVGILGTHKVHLWASLPCRPWSQWNELNSRKLGKSSDFMSRRLGKNRWF
jgi:hypothetical protein